MKFLWILPFLTIGTSAVLHDVWDAFIEEINSHAVVSENNATTPEPPPNFECDPPFEHPHVFDCNVEGKRSKERPTSVHYLMPGDIDVIGALGDSITAAYGAGACQLPGVLTEYRGISWSIGGDNTVEETMTLANIFKKFNPNIQGYSYGRGRETSRFNCAVGGAVSEDIYDQAQVLVTKIKADENVNVEEDWKLVTIFIGGNDLCPSCRNKHKFSAEQYVENIKKGIDYLYHELPRTVVNVIGILNILELAKLTGPPCDLIHELVCDCAMNLEPAEKEEMELLIFKYQVLLEKLVLEGPYNDRDDFTVLYQPFFEETKMPLDENGNADGSYFAPDCFHFSAKGHALGAKEIWNNMLEPVGEKHRGWDPEGPVFCPNEEFPYIYTNLNSNGLPEVEPTAGASHIESLFTALLSTICLVITKVLT